MCRVKVKKILCKYVENPHITFDKWMCAVYHSTDKVADSDRDFRGAAARSVKKVDKYEKRNILDRQTDRQLAVFL